MKRQATLCKKKREKKRKAYTGIHMIIISAHATNYYNFIVSAVCTMTQYYQPCRYMVQYAVTILNAE